MVRILPVVVSLCAGALAIAQETKVPGSTVLRGRVVDGVGKPVAGANVSLLHRPFFGHADVATEHRLRLQTAADGMFRAELRAGAPYSVWAATSAEASDLSEGVDGGFLELRLRPDSVPEEIVVAGLDAWPDAPELHFRAVVGSENVDWVSLEVEQGRLRLPPLPPLPRRTILVSYANGQLVFAERPQSQPTDGGREMVFTVPPPQRLSVQVTGPDGAPLPGVMIRGHLGNHWGTESRGVLAAHRFQALWPVLGTTGADGAATLATATPSGARPWLLMLSKPGFATVLAGVHEGRRFVGEQVGDEHADAANSLPVRMLPGGPTHLRLTGAAASPAADAIWLHGRVRWRIASSARHGTVFHAVARIVDDGVLFDPPLPDGFVVEAAFATLREPARTELRQRFARPAPVTVPWFDPQPLSSTKPAAKAPAGFRSLRVVAADGRPAAQVSVLLGPADRSFDDGFVYLVRTGHTGSAVFPIAAAGALRAVVLDPAGSGDMTIAADGDAAPILQLAAPSFATVHVVDLDGGDVGAAEVRVSWNPIDRSDPHRALMANQPPCGADAGGRCRVLLPPRPAEIVVHAAKAWVTGKAHLGWDPTSKDEIRVVLGR